MKNPSLTKLIRMALEEDIPNGDISTELVVPNDQQSEAVIIAKAPGAFYGSQVMTMIMDQVDPASSLSFEVKDGDTFLKGDSLIHLSGATHSLLKAERTLLNFLQRLCGVASQTKRFVDALDSPNIHVLDTRKTTPGWRDLEKAAVLAGGGMNHRQGLSDMVLLKENHLSALDSQGRLNDLGQLILAFKTQHPGVLVEVEIETLDQLETLSLDHVDMLLLDNFALDQIHPAVSILKKRGLSPDIEISGNITLDTISKYRGYPIHRISVGALTHSVPALDLSLLFQ
ncbi:carboxylating nicotinate-nucleotide diphosphorylase [bacterium]|jgi:nicotinate-nucleotide pyrophosphorylase (carboxylating)|nr:carboxylating nicotinate-nucleotide diphosphorylase [bacterium]